MKVTKAAISKFIRWSTSRYNNYLNFGTKKENVEIVYKALTQGFHIARKWSTESKSMVDERVTKFKIECSQGNGEGQGYRYWRLKGRKGDFSYEIDCAEQTITGLSTGNVLRFKDPS